jgi:hypothetical protein
MDKKLTVGELLDYINELAQDNPDLLDLKLDGFIVDSEFEITVNDAV